MGSPSDTSGNKTKVIIAAAIAVGGLGVAALLFYASAGRNGCTGSYKRNLKNGALSFPGDTDPHRATQTALGAIRDKNVKSIGALVNLLRGPAEVVFPGEQLKNAYHIRAPAGVLQFLQESYLPATALTASSLPQSPVSPTAPSAAATTSPVLPIERPMMVQLLACDVALRRLERERATPFDNDNRAHVNLLQQLWVAAGRPLSSYARTGRQWMELGFQSEDPTTDLRGAGVLGLRQFVHFAQRQPQAMRQMMEYNARIQDAHKDSWYLIAVVSLQFTAQLLLQRDHCFYVNHLQVLYDTLTPTAATGCGGASSASATASPAAVAASAGANPVSRDARVSDVMEKTNTTAAQATAKVWTDGAYVSDAEAGLFYLHERLLLHFKACWQADEPHVMSYNTYVADKVFAKFFTSSWTP